MLLQEPTWKQRSQFVVIYSQTFLSACVLHSLRFDTNLRFVDWKGKRQCEIFDLSKEKEIETHQRNFFFSEETEVFIGWEVKKDNLLSNDHISPVKAS